MKYVLLTAFIFVTGISKTQHCGYDFTSAMLFDIQTPKGKFIPNLKITLLDSTGKPAMGQINYGCDLFVNTVYVVQPGKGKTIYQLNSEGWMREQTLPPFCNPYYTFVLRGFEHDPYASKFQILIEDTDGIENGGYFETKKLALQSKDLYHLCTGKNEKRIKPVNIVLSAKEESNPSTINGVNDIVFKQRGCEVIVNNEMQTIRLKKKPFSIRFMNKAYDEKNENYYNAQIAVRLKPDDFPCATGMSCEEVPYFVNGTGMAPGVSGNYENAIITADPHANHYIVYDGDDDNRATLIAKKGDMLELEWTVHNFFFYGITRELTEIEDLPENELYIYIFIDRNLDKIIDAGELRKVKLEFEN